MLLSKVNLQNPLQISHVTPCANHQMTFSSNIDRIKNKKIFLMFISHNKTALKALRKRTAIHPFAQQIFDDKFIIFVRK